MSKKSHHVWTAEEKALLQEWLDEYPRHSVSALARMLEPVLEGISFHGIRTQLYALKNQPQEEQAPQLREVEVPTAATTTHKLNALAAWLEKDAQILLTRAETLRQQAKDVEALEKFAEDVVNMRTRLTVRVDSKGVVHSVKKKEDD